jgi:pimeloyl-ACP methyl ester carboxylesterase
MNIHLLLDSVLQSDAFSACVLLGFFSVLILGQLSSSRWIRYASYVVMFVTLVLFVRTYRNLMKGLSRPTYGSRLEQIAQGKYHLRTDLNAQPVTLYAQDGMRIEGALVLRPQAKGTVIVFHGWRSGKDLVADYADALPEYNFFLFDFRAHGESAGNRMTLGHEEIQDACAALRFVQTNEATKNLPVYGIGISLGGAILSKLAYENPQAFKALVIDSSFPSLYHSSITDFKKRSSLPVVPFFNMFKWLIWLLTGNNLSLNPAFCLSKLQVPTMIVQAGDDDRVFPRETEQLYQAVKSESQKRISHHWIAKNCKHGGICSADRAEYGQQVQAFFNKI